MRAVVWKLIGIPLGLLYGGATLAAFDYHALFKIFRQAPPSRRCSNNLNGHVSDHLMAFNGMRYWPIPLFGTTRPLRFVLEVSSSEHALKMRVLRRLFWAKNQIQTPTPLGGLKPRGRILSHPRGIILQHNTITCQGANTITLVLVPLYFIYSSHGQISMHMEETSSEKPSIIFMDLLQDLTDGGGGWGGGGYAICRRHVGILGCMHVTGVKPCT